MNSLFEGAKIPTALDSIKQLDEANEVSLNTLLRGMSEVELDFLRCCLVIDGQQRKSVLDLISHQYFDEEFKQQFEREFSELLRLDKEHTKTMAQQPHLTKDGRDELPLNEIFTDSDLEEDSDDESSGGEKSRNSTGLQREGIRTPSQRLEEREEVEPVTFDTNLQVDLTQPTESIPVTIAATKLGSAEDSA